MVQVLHGRATTTEAVRRAIQHSQESLRALFSVSVASAVKWSRRLRQTGNAAAKPQGRRQPRSLAPHQAWILGGLEEEKVLTMRALALELGARGIVTSEVSVWRLVRDARLSFKKTLYARVYEIFPPT